MATKQEISEELNNRLDTDLDWDEMKKDDLEEILFMMETDEFIQKILKWKAKDMGAKSLEDKIDEWYPFKYARAVL